MSWSEIKKLSRDQLFEKKVELKKKYLNFRFQKASGQLENTSVLSTVRRDIARVYTALVTKKDKE